ncbi:hypothetical protein BKA61DRAFT_709941 [Leptodontidium sp. MPI-SDFR-AT-0119]|nr:hypothetical protein BKA61DRAFT_709941 [Leptodontidium sp. MPI-SDFR-AT-0119]
MPGVPSGRGCDACRKQKKKCDQSKPLCARCTRLEIPCVGGGQRRFKFIEEQSRTHYVEVFWTPSSDRTMMMGAFCSALGVTDVRYDLSVYGGFLKDIPKRLGTNTALDASVEAMTDAFQGMHSLSQKRSVAALKSYGHALKTLRESLNDPAESSSANTMCAVYLMLICQGWLGGRDDRASHGEALAYLLNLISSQGRQDDFEAELVITLCVPVIVEAIGNPRIKLHPWLAKFTAAHDKSIPIESIKLSNLAKFPDYFNHPEPHALGIQSTYQQIRTDLPAIKNLLQAMFEKRLITLHARYQTLYSIQLAVAVMLNTLLRLFDPTNLSLVEECVQLVDEIISVAEAAVIYRPLGSSAVPICLICAWPATDNMVKRAKMEQLVEEYSTDFPTFMWMEMAQWLQSKLEAHSLNQCLNQLSTLGIDSGWDSRLEMPKGAAAACSVM